jgi:hypothetical protein
VILRLWKGIPSLNCSGITLSAILSLISSYRKHRREPGWAQSGSAPPSCALFNIHCALKRIYGRGQGEILNERWCFAGESLSIVLCGILGLCNKEAYMGRMLVFCRPVTKNQH